MMLAQLLAEIHSGNAWEVRQLAERLNTSPQMVQAMLEHLERTGVIQSSATCQVGCGNCSLQQACRAANHSDLRLWQVKNKE